ncbi:MAG TPA: class I SAM-dependent methyltransferase, partial [Thermoanaerobaculia bacterium]|nr:class I SAM-dependent methyltransferase [Thermoanaerobaculia bacterium]
MDESASYQYFEDVNWGLLRLWGKRRGLRVLDAGCGFAATSEYIQKRGNDVTGIESSAAACAVAAKRLSRVIHADLVTAPLDGLQFDVIIFADVLEHLPWPVGVLKRYLSALAPNGSIIVSLPNVGLWSVRLAHLAGRWDYEETGVLDRTHLRFFTRKSARWLLEQAGLEPVKTVYNPGLVRPFVPLAKKLLAKREQPSVIPSERSESRDPLPLHDARVSAGDPSTP